MPGRGTNGNEKENWLMTMDKKVGSAGKALTDRLRTTKTGIVSSVAARAITQRTVGENQQEL